MKTLESKARLFAVAISFLCADHLFAQGVKPSSPTATAACASPLILRLSLVDSQLQYELAGKITHGYPLDSVAHEMDHCWPNRYLFVVATWDVPLFALNTPSKLQLSKVRYFIKGRDEHIYTEVAYGSYYPRLPVTPDIAPLPEDDGTPHPPTKIPRMKGPQ